MAAAADPFFSIRGGKAGPFIEPYVRLIQHLHPRAKGIALYDATGTLVWQKESELDTSLTGQVRALVQDASDPEKSEQIGSHRLLQGATPAYLLWLRDDRNAPVGILGVTTKTPSMSMAPPTLADMEKALQPALQCLGRELSAMRRLPSPAQDQVTARLEQAEWVTEKILPLTNATAQVDPLRSILAALVDRADAALAALIIPDRSIRIVVEPEGWNNEKAREALRRLHRRVLSTVQSKRQALISNRAREDEGEAAEYRSIAVPILQRADHAMGYLLLLKSHIASEFGPNDQRLLERIAPLLRTVVERDYDVLTDLRSGAGLEQAARQVLPADGTPPSHVILIDIVGLSEINARLGFDAADRVIRRVAKQLRPPAIPGNALCARLSGGRFACLLPRRDLEDAEEIATRIREVARKLAAARESRVMEVCLRTGVAAVPPVAAGLRHALIAAHALARDTQTTPEAKPDKNSASGRSHGRSGRQPIPVELREALREGRLRIFAQPMHPLKDPKLPLRFELLPRIVADGGRIITPMEFLAAGPDPDALNELDRWVLSAALETMVEHSETLSARRIEFAMNVSGRSLELAEFHEWVFEQLRRGIVPADSWLFEVSETIAARQHKDMARFARRVLSAGARIVLDDVGSAGTDAVPLRTHHASVIKMDGSLVRDLADDARAQRLVQALAHWATHSRMEVVAEQVESELVRDRLKRFGIDYVQGYVISEPQPLDKLLEELAPQADRRATGT